MKRVVNGAQPLTTSFLARAPREPLSPVLKLLAQTS